MTAVRQTRTPMAQKTPQTMALMTAASGSSALCCRWRWRAGGPSIRPGRGSPRRSSRSSCGCPSRTGCGATWGRGPSAGTTRRRPRGWPRRRTGGRRCSSLRPHFQVVQETGCLGLTHAGVGHEALDRRPVGGGHVLLGLGDVGAVTRLEYVLRATEYAYFYLVLVLGQGGYGPQVRHRGVVLLRVRIRLRTPALGYVLRRGRVRTRAVPGSGRAVPGSGRVRTRAVSGRFEYGGGFRALTCDGYVLAYSGYVLGSLGYVLG